MGTYFERWFARASKQDEHLEGGHLVWRKRCRVPLGRATTMLGGLSKCPNNWGDSHVDSAYSIERHKSGSIYCYYQYIHIYIYIYFFIYYQCVYIYIWYPPPPVIYLFWGRLRKCLGFRAEVGQSALPYCRFPSVWGVGLRL